MKKVCCKPGVPATDYSQGHPGPDKELREAQLELRCAEIEEAYQVMREIHDGRGEAVAEKNLRRKGYVGASSRGLDGIDWSTWKGRFHLEEVTMLGHSFGAATVVEILRHPDRFPWVAAGIVYDMWGAAVRPLSDEPGEGRSKIAKPLLGINSEAFMYWDSNFNTAMSLVNEARESNALAYLLTVRGTIHISQSDFPLLYPRMCSLFMVRGPLNPSTDVATKTSNRK